MTGTELHRWPLDYLLTPVDGGLRWSVAGVAIGVATVAALGRAAWSVARWAR
jgi:hypothetical protein